MASQHSEELEKSREASEKLESIVKRSKDELTSYIASSKEMKNEIKEGVVLLAAYNQDLEDAKIKLEAGGDFKSEMDRFKNNLEEAKEKVSKVRFLFVKYSIY